MKENGFHLAILKRNLRHLVAISNKLSVIGTCIYPAAKAYSAIFIAQRNGLFYVVVANLNGFSLGSCVVFLFHPLLHSIFVYRNASLR